VQQSGLALEIAAAACKADRQIVLVAVQGNGCALQHAADKCKADHEIVLAAVQQNVHALQFAAQECKADRAFVLAAAQHDPLAIHYASDELLLDHTFAPEAKQDWYILKVSMLSGRSTVVMGEGDDNADPIVRRCCSRLQIQKATAQVKNWPGLRPQEEVSEYQLVMGAQ